MADFIMYSIVVYCFFKCNVYVIPCMRAFKSLAGQQKILQILVVNEMADCAQERFNLA